jgi:hypothetical protein
MNSQNLPFTREQFLGMFEVYNRAIWPMQIVAYLLGIAVLGLIVWRLRGSDRLVAGILAAFWFWLGGVFLWTYQRSVDAGPGPIVFAAAFVLQGALFFTAGTLRRDLSFHIPATWTGFAGALLIAYAMLVYPLLGLLNGHVYPRQPMFGVAPCPTTIFTLGVLLLSATRVPRYLLVIPVAWALSAGIAAPMAYGVYEDFGLLFAGIFATGALIWRDRPLSFTQHGLRSAQARR